MPPLAWEPYEVCSAPGGPDEAAKEEAAKLGLLPPVTPCAPQAVPRCPLVFVYNLTSPFQDLKASDLDADSERLAFGERLDQEGPFFDTEPGTMAVAWLHRLRRGGRCLAADPRQANLFLIPLLAAPKGEKAWGHACQSLRGRAAELQGMLPHLTSSTATRHFFLVDVGFWALENCTGFWSSPHGHFKKVARVSTEVGITSQHKKSYSVVFEQGGWGAQHRAEEAMYPRLYTLPHVSAVHATRRKMDAALPWQLTEPRTLLASFLSNSTGGDTSVRKRLLELCERHASEGRQLLWCEPARGLRALQIKQRSVFCLEPMSAAIGSRSVSDDYALGCIPVFFGAAQSMQFPEMWDGWSTSAFVAIDRKLFTNNSGGLLEYLEKLVPQRVAAIQAQIAQHGGRFQFCLDDHPRVEDSFSVMLRHLWAAARLREQ